MPTPVYLDRCPAPWCESPNVEVHQGSITRLYYAECPDCGCSGPFAQTKAEAAEKWNSRSTNSLLLRALTTLQETDHVLALCPPSTVDPVIRQAVSSLGESVGFGALMVAASGLWRETLQNGFIGAGGGEFAVGPCRATVDSLQAKVRETIAAIASSERAQA